MNRLTKLVLSHGDLHHIGGAETLAELFEVRTVHASPLRFRSTAYKKALAHFSETPRRLQSLSRNDMVGLWRVLHPAAEDRYPKADDGVIVLSGVVRGTRVLLASDLGRAGQNALLERDPDLRADILVTGLPSTGEAIGDAFLDAVQPKVIIVVDSEFPVLERASPALRNRLERRSIPVIYTRFSGAATIEFKPNGWLVTTMKGTRVSSQVYGPQTQRRPGSPAQDDEAAGQVTQDQEVDTGKSSPEESD